MVLRILIKAADCTMCEYIIHKLAHNIRLYVILFSGDEVILIAYYFQEINNDKIYDRKILFLSQISKQCRLIFKCFN